MPQYRVSDTDRSVVWYAGYVLGHISRNSSGLPYPDPPFDSENLPDNADPELVRAIEVWQDSRVLACVKDGQVVRDLPWLYWIEQAVSFLFGLVR